MMIILSSRTLQPAVLPVDLTIHQTGKCDTIYTSCTYAKTFLFSFACQMC